MDVKFSRPCSFGVMPLKGQVYWIRLHIAHFCKKWWWFVAAEAISSITLIVVIKSIIYTIRIMDSVMASAAIAVAFAFLMVVASLLSIVIIYLVVYVIRARVYEIREGRQ